MVNPVRSVVLTGQLSCIATAARDYSTWVMVCVSLSVTVGQTFDSFNDFLAALEKVKNEGCHPLRVFNSQKGEDYNRKRLTRKFPGDPVDVNKIQYTYYSVKC